MGCAPSRHGRDAAALSPGDDMAALVRELIGEIRGLREEIAILRKAEPSADAGNLLAAIMANIGSCLFTTAELFRHADVIEDDALRTAIAGRAPRRIGKLLRSVEGHVIQGYRVERVADERAGAIWCVKVVSD